MEIEATITFNVTQGEHSIHLYVIPTSLICLLVACYLAVSFCTVIGNSMVIYIVAKSRKMQTVTNYFIANLAASDLVIGALAMPFQFQAALLQQWVLPYFLCSFCPTVQVVSLNVSIFTLVIIALERYRAVIYPLHAKTSRGSAKKAIGFIWGISILLALPTYVGLKVTFIMDPETGNYTKPFCDVIGMGFNTWRVYSYVLVVVQYLIPLCIICYAYIYMGVRLCRETNVLIDSGTNLTNSRKNKRKVVKMLLIVISLFTICWFPYQMYNVLQEVYPSINEYKYINITWFSFHLLAMSNSCHNPFIYFMYCEKFNCEFKRQFALCCCGHCVEAVPEPALRRELRIVSTSHFDFTRSSGLGKVRSTLEAGAPAAGIPDHPEGLERSVTFSGTTQCNEMVTVVSVVTVKLEMMQTNGNCSRSSDDEEFQL